MNDLVSVTRKKFSFAWIKFAKKEVERQWYKDSFSYLRYIPKEIFIGEYKIGLDVGCGSGSDMIHLGQYGAKIVGIDISDAIKVTRDNIINNYRLCVVQADIYNLPFKNETFNFIYSFGVLHHLPDPEKGFRILCDKVKKDGFVIIYVYEDFSDRAFFEKLLLKIINFLRLITTKMPPALLYLFSVTTSPIVFLSCSMPYQILAKIPGTRNFSERIPFKHTTRLDCIASDLYDRFSSPIECRYSRKEIEEWFKKAHLEDTNIVKYRGWVAWGRKR